MWAFVVSLKEDDDREKILSEQDIKSKQTSNILMIKRVILENYHFNAVPYSTLWDVNNKIPNFPNDLI